MSSTITATSSEPPPKLSRRRRAPPAQEGAVPAMVDENVNPNGPAEKKERRGRDKEKSRPPQAFDPIPPAPLTPIYSRSRSPSPSPSSAEPEQLGFSHNLPLILAVLPPVGALVFGSTRAWVDLLMLICLAFYLYFVVRAPWEIYYASVAAAEHENASDPSHKAAITSLRTLNLFSLSLTLLSPLLGSLLLHLARTSLSSGPSLIDTFSIRLFLLASGIKPLLHLVSILRSRSLSLHAQLRAAPPGEVERLQRRVARLECELDDWRRLAATKRESREWEASLSALGKALRRGERRDELIRVEDEERFARLESRLDDLALLEELLRRSTARRSSWNPLAWALGLPRPAPQVRAVAWHRRGVFAVVFLPLNVTLSVMEAVKSKVLGRSIERPQTVVVEEIPKKRRLGFGET